MSKEKTITFHSQWGTEETVIFYKSNYVNNNNIYVGIICCGGEDDGMPYGDLTVNLIPLEKNRACIDTNDCDHNLIAALIDKGLIIPMEYTIPSGFCTYPVCMLTEEFLNEWCIE